MTEEDKPLPGDPGDDEQPDEPPIIEPDERPKTDEVPE